MEQSGKNLGNLHHHGSQWGDQDNPADYVATRPPSGNSDADLLADPDADTDTDTDPDTSSDTSSDTDPSSHADTDTDPSSHSKFAR